jgi:SAM-dependent methyltransferase
MQWFHAIDFGDFGSSGRFRKGSPQNSTLFGTFEMLCAMNLDGATVLDLDTVDGIVAFGARSLGAQHVVATDTHDRASFRLAREILGFGEEDIRYLPGIQVKDLPEHFEPKSLDVIICAGIFYHMLHPMQAFTDCRKVLGDDGYLIVETPFEDGREEAVLIFNGIEHKVNEPYSYFIPTRSALTGMANLAGLEVVATRVLSSPKRITLLMRASSRDRLCTSENVAPFIKQMLKRDTCDDSFRHLELEKIQRPARDVSGAVYGLPAFREIDPLKEIVNFPFHLSNDEKGLGRTMWEEVTGNTKIL